MKTKESILPLSAVVLAVVFSQASAVYAQGKLPASQPASFPVPARVQPLRLQKPFTIVYKVAVSFFNDGKMTSQPLRITLSYDGERLLYRSEETRTHVIHTLLYSGGETFESDSNSRIAQIESGFDFSRMLYCPLPGVGIPNRPFFSSGIPENSMAMVAKNTAAAQEAEPKYIDATLYRMPGQSRDYGVFLDSDREAMTHAHSVHSGVASVVSVTTPGAPKVLWYDTFDNVGPNLGTLWEYGGHRGFQGIWLATKMRMRMWTVMPHSEKNIVLVDAQYDLESAVDGPVEPKAYEPATYLLNHASVTDFTGSKSKSFVYYTDKGSLQGQRGGAFDVREALARNSAPRTTNTGVIGLVMVILMSAAWFFWRRIRRSGE